ncbi:efflux transporter, outer membrane factor (OMF) lipoprotein, NodT family [Polaromonas sp. YR568]|nr:efflux transporter, outer membrane factor (OMF) lipoprotein, NodT family [Polaromonas sp. YR568]
MTNNSNTLCTAGASSGAFSGQANHTEQAQSLPVWRASFRMALVAAASVVAVGIMATGLTGCADMSGISPQSSLRDAPSLGLKAQGTETATAQAPVAAEWWREFGDEQLNTLVAQALQTSPTLKLAQARLARAQAVTEVADAATLPQLTGQLDATRQRYTANGAVPPPLAGSIRESGTAQLNASWELDFFGKNRAALDAALGSANAAEADAQAARVLLASNVARTYFQLVRLNEQTNVARRTLAQREETLKLVRDRVDAGLDTRLELRQSEGGLPEARLQLETLQEQMALTRNALGALIGQPNGAANVVVQTPPEQSAIKNVAVAANIPADLLGRRADIAAARWRVEASSKDVVNAKTQFYPNINLVAFAGFSSIGLGQLTNSGSQQWGIGPALRLPIFDAGRLRANLRGKTADLDAAVESYNAAVIDAVRDVADQVASSQAIVRQQTEQRAAQEAAESAYEIAVQRYKAGLGNYLNVLTAETSVLAQRRQAVDLAARALDTQVALIRALGGGYTATQAQAAASVPPAAPTDGAIKKVADYASPERAGGTFLH